MDYCFIRKALKQTPNLISAFGKPLICSAVMGAFAWGIYQLTMLLLSGNGKLEMFLCMVIAIAAAVVVYLLCVIRLGCITNQDMKLIPGGERIGHILNMK